MATFYKDWQGLEQAYFAKVPGKSKYELWSKFAFEKMTDASLRIAKAQESKKELQLKQQELEIGRLNTLLEMKGQQKPAENGDIQR